jgi:hypothetical protein
MIITIETSSLQEIKPLLLALKSLNIKSIKIQESPVTPKPIITRGNKKLDPKALLAFGRTNHEQSSKYVQLLFLPDSIL